MSRNPMQDAIERLQAVAQRRGGGFGGGLPPTPRGLGGIVGGLVLLGGGAMLLQNSLFNVDGGHRAIKYRRISGVSKEIYGEGPSGTPGPSPLCNDLPYVWDNGS